MSWLLLNSVFSKIFSGLWDVCLVTIWPQRTSMLLSAFCSWCFRISGMHRRQNFMLLSSQFLPSTFLFPVISYFCSPPLFFSWAFTMLHFGRKSFHENQENCEIISQFTFIIWKGEEMGWSGARLLLEFSVQPCMFFFFGILSHLVNWIVLICVYMSMERWLIHKLGGKVVYDH